MASVFASKLSPSTFGQHFTEAKSKRSISTSIQRLPCARPVATLQDRHWSSLGSRTHPTTVAIEYPIPPVSEELLYLSERFPGGKVEQRGNNVTIAYCDALSDSVSAELSAQLRNWARIAKTHTYGGSNTAFKVQTFVRKLSSDGERETYVDNVNGGRREGTFCPDAYIMSREYYNEVKRGGQPEIYGCVGALMCEVLSPSDMNPNQTDGSRTVSSIYKEV
jgi:hypothetical protein